MTVKQLTQDQLNELKQRYYYDDNEEAQLYYYEWQRIPNFVIYDWYNDIEFVKDDFFCSIDEYEPMADYDSPEDIQKCLNCQKADCDNCLKTINGV